MTSEWEDSTLGDVLTLQRGMDLPVQERKGGRHPIVASTGVVGFHDEAPVKAPGVVIGRSGSIGGGQFIDQDFWPLNTTLWVKDFKGNDPRYCYYLLKSIDFSSMNAGSGVPTLNRNHLHPMRVAKPPVSVQKSISGMLGALDDRITLLNETNATLEAIAQALFKSWFVDFDPVRAKSEGQLPEGLEEGVAALFPNSFVETELGLVPEGWGLCALYDLATYINGASYKAFEPNSIKLGLPIIKIAELKAGVTANTAYSSVEMPKKYLIETGDILFSWSGNPDTSIDTFVWSYEAAWLNQHIFRVLPLQKNERAFVLQTLKNFRPVFAELARNKQTTGLGHVTVADLKRLLVAKPNQQILDVFAQVVGVIQERIFQNTLQANTLSNLRDTLLPRLISGKLRIADVEAKLEKVTA